MRFGKFVLFRFLHKNRKSFSFILIHRFLRSVQGLFSTRVPISEKNRYGFSLSGRSGTNIFGCASVGEFLGTLTVNSHYNVF